MKLKKLFWTRKQLIKEFAKEIATLQMKADKWFYVFENQDHSSLLLDQAYEIKEWCKRLGICDDIYREAYKIYDFRNSGRKDFAPNIEFLKTV